MKKLLAIMLSLVLLLGCTALAEESTFEEKVTAYLEALSAPVEIEGLNAMHSSYDDMLAYLTEKGCIDPAAVPVDMTATAGYLTDNTGGSFPTYGFADKAYDYNGVYLLWWDLASPTAAYDCYVAWKNNGAVVIMGGAAVLQFEGAMNGSYVLGFSADVAEEVKAAALKEFKAIDATAHSIAYMGSAAELAMALFSDGLLAATDVAGVKDVNQQYEYTCTRQDWVGYDVSESGYGEPYETTAKAVLASQASQFGKLTILYFAPADIAANSYTPHLAAIYNQAVEQGSVTPYCRPSHESWDYVPYTVDGAEVVLPVDGVYGNFVVIFGE